MRPAAPTALPFSESGDTAKAPSDTSSNGTWGSRCPLERAWAYSTTKRGFRSEPTYDLRIILRVCGGRKSAAMTAPSKIQFGFLSGAPGRRPRIEWPQPSRRITAPCGGTALRVPSRLAAGIVYIHEIPSSGRKMEILRASRCVKDEVSAGREFRTLQDGPTSPPPVDQVQHDL